MNRSAQYESPDGVLKLVIIEAQDDITVGFEGCPWHTHGDVLAGTYESRGDFVTTPKAAADRFVAEIMNDKVLLAVASVEGRIQDIWPTDDPAGELRYKTDQETIEFRYWDGTP